VCVCVCKIFSNKMNGFYEIKAELGNICITYGRNVVFKVKF